VKITFTASAWEDYVWFQDHDRKLLKRINQLIKDVQRSPFEGIGKPEPLKADLAGYWSRRINDEHRLVYTATEHVITIIACRYHYGK
jgi:toxin YoeB